MHQRRQASTARSRFGAPAWAQANLRNGEHVKKSKPIARLEHSLTHGNLWLSIMSLMKSRKVYAYVLPDEIHKKFGFSPSKLMVYFVLYKLEDEGLISAAFEGRRKYYELTAKGKSALSQGKSSLSSLSKKL